MNKVFWSFSFVKVLLVIVQEDLLGLTFYGDAR
jgi:hypothetical protein